MKKIIAIISLVLLIVAVPIGVYLVSQQQDIRKKAAPTAVLAFIPENSSKIVNDEFDVQIELTTGENDISAGDVSIQFDPNYLEVIDVDPAVTGIQVTPGTILPSGWILSNQANNATGTILLSIGTRTSYRGQGIFGTIKFKAKAPVSSTTISFNPAPDTKLIAVGGESILGTQNTATVVITTGGGNSPTATPTPTTPAGAATATPTPTGTTAAATSTPTPTTGAGVTSTPTPTRTVNATNTPTPIASTDQVKLTSITSGQTVPTSRPVFSGTATPNSAVTITVRSDPITATVTTDASGRWTWTPTVDLGPGSHTVTITAVTPAGKTTTTTSSFTVGSLPVTGNISLTLILLGCGLLILLPVFVILVKKAPVIS